MAWTKFHDIQFPPDISYGAVFGPEFQTGIVKTNGGSEQRNQDWNHPLYSGDVAQGVKNQKQLNRLLAFFMNRKGRAYGFRYKDWSDYQAINQTIGTSTAVGQTFQLSKTYIDDMDYETIRPIYKPVSGKVIIYRDGIMQNAGWTIDYNTGIFTANLTGVWTADFDFDVPVRFDNDKMPISIDNFNLYSWNNIPITELRG